jgi:hypothetical protein
MTDRASQQPDSKRSDNAADQALELARRQILLHEKHDRKQSLLASAATFVLRNGSGESLRELKTLYQEAKDARGKNDVKKADELEKQLAEKVKTDRAALNWQDETNGYATGFAKTMGLFMKGSKGVALTALSFGLDQVCAGDTTMGQGTDLVLGVGKGLLTRKVLGAAGSWKMGIAGEAMTLGVGSRIVDQALTRGNYFDASGQFSLSQALGTIDRVALDRTALASDVATFAGAKLFFGAASRFSNGALERSPFLTTMLTGTTFGASSGAASEIIRQHQIGQSLDLGKILRCAAIQGLVDSVAATPGGLQADAPMRARLAGKMRTGYEWLKPGASRRLAIQEAPAANTLHESKSLTQQVITAGENTGSNDKKSETVKPPAAEAADSSKKTKGNGAGSDLKVGGDGVAALHDAPAKSETMLTPTEPKPANTEKGADGSSGTSENAAKSSVKSEKSAPISLEVVKDGQGAKVADDRAPEKVETKFEKQPVVSIEQARSDLIKAGAHKEVVARMSAEQVRAVRVMDEAVRAHFVDDALSDKSSSLERIDDAVRKANDFAKLPLSEQCFEAEREVRSWQGKLGLDSKKPLSASDWTRFERSQDLFRTRLGLVLDEIARPDHTEGSAERKQELQALFSRKIFEFLLKPLDIGNVKTLSGGNSQELIVFREMEAAMRRAGNYDDLRLVRLLNDHAADHCGFDFVLVNTRTGRILPVDATSRNKFEPKSPGGAFNELPEMRSRTVVSVPDPKTDDVAKLWESLRKQQGIPEGTPVPSIPEILKLRCDYIVQLLETSPIRATDVRLLFDELADRQQFSRRITDADRREYDAAKGGMGKRWLFKTSTGDLVDPAFTKTRTLSPGMEAVLRRSMLALDRVASQGVVPDAATLAQLDSSRRLVQMQVDSMGRFIHDLDVLAEQKRRAGDEASALLLENWASHTENVGYRYWNRKLTDGYGIIARINRALGKQ